MTGRLPWLRKAGFSTGCVAGGELTPTVVCAETTESGKVLQQCRSNREKKNSIRRIQAKRTGSGGVPPAPTRCYYCVRTYCEVDVRNGNTPRDLITMLREEGCRLLTTYFLPGSTAGPGREDEHVGRQ